MDHGTIIRLNERLVVLRKEVEALVQESDSFPAVRQNAVRMEACLRMLEVSLMDPDNLPADLS